MDRYAGVVIDFYDDRGELLRSRFPTADSLPSFIKTANIRSPETMGNEEFALVAIDGPNVMRKFACSDAGTTAMSVMYFMANKDKLPEDAIKTAAANLTLSCLRHNMVPPEDLIKAASAEKLAALPLEIAYHLARNAEHAAPGAVEHSAPILEDVAKSTGIKDWLRAKYQGAVHEVLDPIAAESQRGLQRLVQGRTPEAEMAIKKDILGKGSAGLERGLGDVVGEQVAASLKKGFKDMVDPAKAHAVGLAKNLAVGGLTGAASGGLGGGLSKDDPYGGMARGMMGGMFGGALGRAFSPGLAPAAIGGAVGGGLAGTAFGEDKSASANMVDITGKKATMKIATASPTEDSDYAVIFEGHRYYPINTLNRIKTAEAYYLNNNKLMDPQVRRSFAVKLASKSVELGCPINDSIYEAGATNYAHPASMKVSLEMRKLAVADKDANKFLDELFEKRAQLDPGIYAECLHRFDRETGIDRLWDKEIIDPWGSTFGKSKLAADEVIFDEDGTRVLESEMLNLAYNRLDLVKEKFTQHIATEFEQDPMGIFHSMPLPQKKLLARMASDASAKGTSSWSVKTAQRNARVKIANKAALPLQLQKEATVFESLRGIIPGVAFGAGAGALAGGEDHRLKGALVGGALGGLGGGILERVVRPAETYISPAREALGKAISISADAKKSGWNPESGVSATDYLKHNVSEGLGRMGHSGEASERFSQIQGEIGAAKARGASPTEINEILLNHAQRISGKKTWSPAEIERKLKTNEPFEF